MSTKKLPAQAEPSDEEEEVASGYVDVQASDNEEDEQGEDGANKEEKDKDKEEEEDESEDDPILFGMNEWLLYDEWSKDYERDEGLWRKKYHIGANNVGYSEKAFRAWATKADERSSKLPKYKQKRRWIYKKKGKQIPATKDPLKTKKILSKPVLRQQKPGR